MFNISLPSFLRARPSTSTPSRDIAIPLPSVPIHRTETALDKPSRTLKHLLKANHANHSVIYNSLRFHNHAPHILGSAYILGSHAEHLNAIYDDESKHLEPWRDSPGEVSLEDWREFLGKREYQRAFLDFFEDQVVRLGYDWMRTLQDFLFDNKGGGPLVNAMVSGLGHPLIHLGYAIELDSGTIGVEALTLGACFYDGFHKYLDDDKYTSPAPEALLKGGDGKESTPLELLHRASKDDRFDGLFDEPGSVDLEKLFAEREEEVLEYWNAWQLHREPKEQFRLSQRAAVAVLVASHNPSRTPDYDFFFCHTLTTSHAVRILLGHRLFDGRHGVLVRQWWLFTLAVYIAQMRPDIREENIWNVELEGRDWDWVTKTALTSKWSLDAHFVKACRAMKEAADTWGDEDGFYLRAAVKFAAEFDGWGGFGALDEAAEELRRHDYSS